MGNDITEPLVLSAGSHEAGSGKGCAMNVISWENGDSIITDYPACSDRMLSRLVQAVNDNLADVDTGLLSAEASLVALDLGHATVGTALPPHVQGPWVAALRAVLHPRLMVLRLDRDRAADATDIVVDLHNLSNERTASSPYLAARIVMETAIVTPGSTEDALVEITREIIAKFKELAGITSPAPDPVVTACAVSRMREVVDGDIGDPLKHIELEPVEEPIPSTVPEEVPA